MATPPNEPDDTVSASSMFNPNLVKKWEALSSLRHKLNINKVVWTNEMLKDRKVINLNAWNHVSVRSVGALMVCAWGLVSCENPNQSVFSGLWESSKATELEEYCNVLPPGCITEAEETVLPDDILDKCFGEQRELELLVRWKDKLSLEDSWVPYEEFRTPWVRTACFYCAAVLGLATKGHDALVKAWSCLPEHYQSFYKTPLEFSLSLDHECFKCVRRLFQNNTIIRNSVAPFLLAFQELSGSKNQGICKTLFENHLGYTGLHAYTLFVSNASKLAVPYHVFRHVLHPSLDEGDKKSKCTWIYSRIFNSDMFGSLQTKRCTFLAALLAVVADTIGGTSSSSGQASNIKQLQGYIDNNKDDLHLWTGRIIAFCNEFNDKESTKKWFV
ncbi:hypothetical protein N665_0418s0005 [Sinapis alba]|nr:hypothetical protein N665_0418s0005 [Sinapis alba]